MLFASYFVHVHIYVHVHMELPDGTNAKVVSRPGESEQVLACVGGTCFIQGIDHSGEDRF